MGRPGDQCSRSGLSPLETVNGQRLLVPPPKPKLEMFACAAIIHSLNEYIFPSCLELESVLGAGDVMGKETQTPYLSLGKSLECFVLCVTI